MAEFASTATRQSPAGLIRAIVMLVLMLAGAEIMVTSALCVIVYAACALRQSLRPRPRPRQSAIDQTAGNRFVGGATATSKETPHHPTANIRRAVQAQGRSAIGKGSSCEFSVEVSLPG
jgi:hypothetical protein